MSSSSKSNPVGPSRQSSLKDFVTRRTGSRRANLTRQHSVAVDHIDDAEGGRQQQQQQQFLLPQPLSPRTQHLAPGHLVHQRSSESHDSSVSATSMASAASYGGRGAWGGGGFSAEGVSMDLLNMKREDSDDEESDGRKDEASIKGLWKRAFSSLKIRDRIKSPKKKKGSKNEEDDIDPVYYLLKHAADKGTQRCPACSQQPTTSSGASASAASVCGSSCSCHCHSRQAQHQTGAARFYQQPPSAPTPPPTPLPSIRLNDPSQASPRRPQSQAGHATLTHQMSAPSAVKRSEQQQLVKNRKK